MIVLSVSLREDREAGAWLCDEELLVARKFQVLAAASNEKG